MDLTPLLQSGNIWLIVAGIAITLATQWAKNKVSPTPTPAPGPAPAPGPSPAPNGTPILDALLALLKTRLLASAVPVSFGEGPVAPSGPTVSPDHEAAGKLMKAMKSLDL